MVPVYRRVWPAGHLLRHTLSALDTSPRTRPDCYLVSEVAPVLDPVHCLPFFILGLTEGIQVSVIFISKPELGLVLIHFLLKRFCQFANKWQHGIQGFNSMQTLAVQPGILPPFPWFGLQTCKWGSSSTVPGKQGLL